MIETPHDSRPEAPPQRRSSRLGTRGKLITELVVGLSSGTLIVVGVPAILFGGWWMPPGFALASLGALGLSWTFQLVLGAWGQ